MVKSGDYHDYVIKNGKLIGRFEEMYRVCEDPWPETEVDLEANPCSTRSREILAAHGYKSVLSIGSGKGLHLNWLRKSCPDTRFFGCDVSETAVEHSKARYPQLEVEVGGPLAVLDGSRTYDLVIFREVVWYVLSEWETICRRLKEAYTGASVLVELTFYDDQTYGKDHFDGPDEFVTRFPFEVREVLRHHITRLQREGMLMVHGDIL